MKKPDNLKEYKTELRTRMRELRGQIPQDIKARMEEGIARQLFGMSLYRNASEIYIYIAKGIEIETRAIIERAWADGKRVAVPRCVENSREMEFFYIDSFDEVKPSFYGLLEPDRNPARLATPTEQTLCVAPATCCDRQGFRLGYGGGYYDRFLNRFNGKSAAIIFSDFVIEKLWHGKFDVAVNFVVTERFVLDCKK